jgi:ABC-2 type transport system ATP-binding protein
MIEIKQLSFGYNPNKDLFYDLNLSLTAGNIYGLLGKNGAGKTSLLKIICGLIFPKRGEVRVFGFDPRARQAELLREIFFLPEEFYLPALSVAQYQKLYGDFYPRFDTKAFDQYLQEFALAKDVVLTSLSYGQKKKFLIAFGLATNSKLLVLDEPTNGLDIPSKSEFRKLLATVSTAERIVVISTHQVLDMENLIDPLVILDTGKIIFHQSLAEIGQRLRFEKTSKEPVSKTIIYAERVPGGFVTVTKSKRGQESSVDLEVLFNALMVNAKDIQALF